MPSQTIQWFPGHMAKTRRLISDNLKNVDIIIEILDARIPRSSKNPEIRKLTTQKPSIILLNKASLADVEQTRLWVELFTEKDCVCIPTDCVTGEGISKIPQAVKEILKDKIERYEEKGMYGRTVKAMVLGIPNVGKSSLINKISKNRKAKVENRPGVTLDKQWVSTSIGIDLLDMPGVLWPKFDERTVGENLAITGAIKDKILDIEEIAVNLCTRLRKFYPALLCERYKLDDMSTYADLSDYDLLKIIGQKRGNLIAGGEVNTERTAIMLVDEYRAGKIGRITLDIAPNKK